MQVRQRQIVILACLLTSTSGTTRAGDEQTDHTVRRTHTARRQESTPVDFRKEIEPIFRKHCYTCHGEELQEGKLRLDLRARALQGNKNGKVILPGQGANSRLIQLVVGPDVAGQRMPPVDEGARLTKRDVSQLRKWIDEGAAWPDERRHTTEIGKRRWSFQPVKRSTPPTAKNTDWARNPVDPFILARLEATGLKPASPASRRALIRRITLNLIGLPPSSAEVDAFLTDVRPAAYERLIDRLLVSPHYGERWGRHWLDLARYADTCGYEQDVPKPLAWKYRDYVIRSLNDGKPYDRFVLEQLAGDELADATGETVIATGFLRVGPWDAERGASVQKSEMLAERFNELDDLVSTTSQVFLGLTMGCARCHNHKFDPLSARDYYSMVAVFSPLSRHRNGRTELAAPAVPPALLKSNPNGSFPQGYFFRETSPKPPVTHLLIRGNPNRPGEIVFPAIPASLVNRQPQFLQPDNHTSRRRLSLARWIVDEQNTFTSRVIVNRVWQHHFGYGLVRTPSDFGKRGDLPSHPKLLDWLAHWFVHDADWSLKRLHRLILTSATFRQSSSAPQPEGTADNPRDIDPDNRLLWHFPYRRLEMEAIRDSMLAVGGQLNEQLYGEPMYPHIPADALRSGYNPGKVWKPFNETDASRRTIYAYLKRTLVVPMFDVLDFCDTARSADRRDITTVAPQALTLLNGEFANRQARHFADRLIREADSDPQSQIELAFRMALSRPPTKSEQTDLLDYLRVEKAAAPAGSDAHRLALRQVCRVILNLNEFVYPD